MIGILMYQGGVHVPACTFRNVPAFCCRDFSLPQNHAKCHETVGMSLQADKIQQKQTLLGLKSVAPSYIKAPKSRAVVFCAPKSPPNGKVFLHAKCHGAAFGG